MKRRCNSIYFGKSPAHDSRSFSQEAAASSAGEHGQSLQLEPEWLQGLKPPPSQKRGFERVPADPAARCCAVCFWSLERYHLGFPALRTLRTLTLDSQFLVPACSPERRRASIPSTTSILTTIRTSVAVSRKHHVFLDQARRAYEGGGRPGSAHPGGPRLPWL